MRTLVLVLVLSSPAWAGPKSDGYAPLASGNRCLEVSGAKLFSADCDGSAKQQWKLTPQKGGFVQITSQQAGDGKCVDIVNDGKANNRLTLAACSNVSGQHWKLSADGRLTTEWRGDGKCLDIVDSTANIQPVLSDCAKSATQRWQVGSSPAVVGKAKPLDGTFEPEIAIVFKDCSFALPGTTNGKPYTIFACAIPTKQRAICRVVYGHLDEAFRASRTVFEAALASDDKAMNLATSDGNITIRVNLSNAEATLNQRDTKVHCNGTGSTADVVRQAIKEMKNPAARRDQPERQEADFGASSSSSSSSRSTPEPKKPKGLAHGRMCGRDSECESGSCKMENRTRGRCS